METFTVRPVSVYFTIIQAIKVALHKYAILGEPSGGWGPHTRGLRRDGVSSEASRSLAARHAAGNLCLRPGCQKSRGLE